LVLVNFYFSLTKVKLSQVGMVKVELSQL
jgi:hypothetical protein